MSSRRDLAIDWATRLVIVAMFAVMVYIGNIVLDEQDKADRQRASAAARGQCLATWAEEFAVALDARVSRTPKVTAARDGMDEATAAVFRAISPLLDPNASREERLRRAHDLQNALVTHEEAYDALSAAIAEQVGAATANPYPENPRHCYDE